MFYIPCQTFDKTTMKKTLFFLIICTFLAFKGDETHRYKIGKTKCTVQIDESFKYGFAYWDNGTKTELRYSQDTGDYIYYAESDGVKYTGTFILTSNLLHGFYVSDCDECNGKTYVLAIDIE